MNNLDKKKLDGMLDRLETEFFLNRGERWSDIERNALAVSVFVGEMANGGLNQYLLSDYNVLLIDAQRGFKKIGILDLESMWNNIIDLLRGVDLGDHYEICDRIFEIIEECGTEALDKIERPFWKIYPTQFNSDWFTAHILAYLNSGKQHQYRGTGK